MYFLVVDPAAPALLHVAADGDTGHADHLGARVGQHVGDLGGLEPIAERYQQGADLAAGVEQLEPLDTIVQRCPNRVARPDSGGQQSEINGVSAIIHPHAVHTPRVGGELLLQCGYLRAQNIGRGLQCRFDGFECFIAHPRELRFKINKRNHNGRCACGRRNYPFLRLA